MGMKDLNTGSRVHSVRPRQIWVKNLSSSLGEEGRHQAQVLSYTRRMIQSFTQRLEEL